MGRLYAAAALLGASALAVRAAQDTVTIQLHAPWNETPLLLEASELFAYESPALFWRLLDAGTGGKAQAEELETKVDSLAAAWLPPLVYEVFEGELAARSGSAAVEAHLAVARAKAANCDGPTPPLFAEVNGVVECTVPTEIPSGSVAGSADIYANDHVYPLAPGVAGDSVPTVILYGRLGDPALHAAHATYAAAAQQGRVRYVMRHHVSTSGGTPLRLAGFGVELDVKKMDYVAKDDTAIADDGTEAAAVGEEDDEHYGGFNFKLLRELHPTKTTELDALKEYVKSTTAAVRELKVWELQDICVQAASRIVRDENPAAALESVSQNFPVLAPVLVHEKVNEELRAEADYNRDNILAPIGLGPGGDLFLINGRIVDGVTSDLYSLLSTLRADAKLLNGLRAVGFPASVVPDIVSLPDSSSGATNPTLDFRHSAVQYMNDLERDPQYKGYKWSSDLGELLRPAMPGAIRYVAKNMWHLLFVIDPASPEGTSAIHLASQLVKDDLPVRFGFLFTAGREAGGGRAFAFSKDGFSKKKMAGNEGDEAAKTDAAGNKASVQMIRAYSYIAEDGGPGEGFAFLAKLAKGGNKTVTTKKVKAEFVKLYGETVWSTLLKGAPKKKHDKLLYNCEKAIVGFGLSTKGPPAMLFNGDKLDMSTPDVFDPDVMTMTLSQLMMEGMPTIQRGLYYGELPQTGVVLDYLMTRPGVVRRLNPRVTAVDGVVLDFSGRASDATTTPAVDIPTTSLAASAASTLHYFEMTSKGKAATFWVVADFDTTQGQRLAFEALRRQLHEKKSRMALVHNGAGGTVGEVAKVIVTAAEVLATTEGTTKKQAVESLGALLAAALNGATTIDALVEPLPDVVQAAVRSSVASAAAVPVHVELCRRALRLDPGAAAVVVNGRVVGPLASDEVLIAEDYKILEKAAQRGVAGKMLMALAKNKDLVQGSGVVDSQRSDFVMAGTALLAASRAHDGAMPTRRLASEYLEGLQTSVVGMELGLSDEALASAEQYHDIVLIVDPLSKTAQHVVPLVRHLATLVSARVRIILNPVEKVSEAPLKRFYRTVLPVTAEQRALGKHSAAVFTKLPTAPLLTLGMHVPPAWLVQAFASPYDLDNIHLESTTNGVHAVFMLENILVEGRCYEDGTYQPTPGLQLQLQPITGMVEPVDTLVMANLGYFQLKANPGVWELGLRPGRSSAIYDFKSVEEVEVTPGTRPNVVLNSFSGTNIYVTMQRRPGMERAKLLDTATADGSASTEDSGGLWGSLSDFVSGGGGDGKDTAQDTDSAATAAATAASNSGRTGETINVFSLASGHLYERFLKIMMLSVLKNTNNPVKFWFLKNCMSPQLQEFLPHFAKEYGFSFELVQYKWPSWLNLPPTKHRQIWGYKILFLDTLFPLDVNKIIFVDADQVVRADLKELLEIDLEGAPYGYTPFCNDRTEMDGFRFWKSGYWKGHLDGRPYHISALYVVDLIRFRQLAAGDRLREQYQGLSRDPNSLSNLDQDLPNNMVHQVPIKSLPQEWLWCETWCSDDIKPQAKTIDLCNNPLTKEPKLEAAVRIVGEWADLDAEARNVTRWVETTQLGGTKPVVPGGAGTGASVSQGHDAKDEL